MTQMKHAESLERIERDVLDVVTSTRPLAEVLNGVCRLAEFAVQGRARCSVLDGISNPHRSELRVISAPSIPALQGLMIPRRALETGGAAMEPYLKLAEAVDSIRGSHARS